MTDDPARSSGRRTSDTQRTAPRRAWFWVVPIGLAALAIMLVAMHFLSATK